jgi:hypothetical protein
MASLAYCNSAPKGDKFKEHGRQLGRFLKGYKWWAGSETVWSYIPGASKSVLTTAGAQRPTPLCALNLHKL